MRSKSRVDVSGNGLKTISNYLVSYLNFHLTAVTKLTLELTPEKELARTLLRLGKALG